MLKPAQEPMQQPDEERPIGDVVGQLVDEGKAYARAELGLVRAQALAKADALKLPVILFAAALLFAQAAVTVLGIALAMALAPRLGPLGGGVLAALIVGGVAGLLGWLGLQKLKAAP